MKRFRHVFELYRLDWQRIFNNKLTLLLIISLMIIPSLYAWFNIAALWDPYSNTKDLEIAVYSDDKTASAMDQEVNVGQTLIENLKENKSLGWQFVDSKQELDRGVKTGKYYAGIYIPANFSEDLLSFVQGNIKNPEIEYSVNEKINAIAPKISGTGANTIKDTISEEFIATASKTLVENLNKIGFDLDSNLPSIKKMTSQILKVNDHLDEIDGYTKEVVALNNKMPELKNKLTLANEFVDLIPELNKMTEKVLSLNEKIPEIEKVGPVVYEVQGSIPEIKAAGKQINQVDEEFQQVVTMMDEGLVEAKEGLGIISDAQKVLPEVNELAITANEMIPEIKTDLKSVEESLPYIASGVSSGLKITQVISSETAKLTAGLVELMNQNDLSEEELATVKSDLEMLSKRLTEQSNMIDTVVELLADLQTLTGTNNLDEIITQLMATKELVDKMKADVDEVVTNWDTIQTSPEQLKQKLQEISQEAMNVSQVINRVDIVAIENSVASLITEAQHLLNTAGNLTNTIISENLISRVDKLMTSTTQTMTQGIQFLETYRQELPAIHEEIHSANQLLNSNMTLIVNGINSGADFFKTDFPKLKSKLNQAATFIETDLPDIESDVEGTMKTVNEKAPQLETALSAATDLIENDWPDIRKSISKASSLIKKGESEFDLDELIKYMKSDANQESQFISNPVKLKQKDVYPVPNYGSASTPFYTALCLWVGAVLFSSIASTKIHLNKEQKLKYSKRQQFLARMMTFLTVSFFQTVIVVLGNQWLLGAYTKNPVWNLLFALLIDLTFMMIVYVLVALFDNLGKGMAIIILVLSISAGGGNFPIQMSGPFFRAINPYIPFTHAVNLFRESVGGIYWPSALKAIVILLSVTIVFFVVGYIIYPKAERLFKKINKKLAEGHILH